jgi:hypothetical protein
MSGAFFKDGRKVHVSAYPTARAGNYAEFYREVAELYELTARERAALFEQNRKVSYFWS